jgi:hypothetical protein
LKELASVQTQLFLDAVRAWEDSGKPSSELIELGGAFLHNAQRFGWIDEGRRLRISERERAVLFEFRWLELAGLRADPAFAPTLNASRRYYRSLLEHPQAANSEDAARAQIGYVDALAKIDPDYPAALAKGVLYQQLGEFDEARRAFELHLQAHPRGAWALRARNLWLATFSP